MPKRIAPYGECVAGVADTCGVVWGRCSIFGGWCGDAGLGWGGRVCVMGLVSIGVLQRG